MLDVSNSDFVRTARAKGVPELRVLSAHVVRNALLYGVLDPRIRLS